MVHKCEVVYFNLSLHSILCGIFKFCIVKLVKFVYNIFGNGYLICIYDHIGVFSAALHDRGRCIELICVHSLVSMFRFFSLVSCGYMLGGTKIICPSWWQCYLRLRDWVWGACSGLDKIGRETKKEHAEWLTPTKTWVNWTETNSLILTYTA